MSGRTELSLINLFLCFVYFFELFLTVLDLWLFSSHGERGYSLVAVRGLLSTVVHLVADPVL